MDDIDIGSEFSSGYQRARPRGLPRALYFKGSKTPKPSSAELAERERAAADWARYKEAYRPLEQKAIKQVKEFNARDRATILKGRGNADIAQAEQQNQTQLREGLRQAGLSITSDKAVADMSNLSDTMTAARNVSQVDAGQQAQAAYDAERMGLVNVGRDKAMTSAQGMSEMTSQGTSRALSKLQADRTVRDALYGAVGTLAGAGTAKAMSMPPKAAPSPTAMQTGQTFVQQQATQAATPPTMQGLRVWNQGNAAPGEWRAW